MAAVTRTICIVGFPPEALPRELKNLCRFMHGFEGAHVAFAGQGQCSSLFVKFTTAELARLAMDTLHGAPFDTDVPQVLLKVEYARREMEVRPSSLLPPPMVTASAPWAPDRAVARPAAPAAPPVVQQGPGGQVRRVGLTGGELTTITVLGLREKGLAPEELKQWFQQRPGFLTLHVNERIDGLFVKFGSGSAAERAIQDANAHQFGAEWARRNLDDDVGPKPPVAPTVAYPSQAPPAYPPQPQPAPPPPVYPQQPVAPLPPAVPAPGSYLGPAKRLRSTVGELDTITILGIREKDLSPDMLQQWFQERPGFVAMQVNERINGVFAKFASQATAMQCLEEANAHQFGAEWARRNLDL